MSERYWITGAQLGLLQVAATEESRKFVIDNIIDKQFICNCFTEEAKKKFEEEVEKLAKGVGEGA
jgi:hypothetical protein